MNSIYPDPLRRSSTAMFSHWMRKSVALVAPLCAFPLHACSAPSKQELHFVLSAKDGTGAPLAEVAFWSNGKLVGKTDSRGEVTGSARGLPGTKRTISRTCPQGFEARDEQRVVRLPSSNNTYGKDAPIGLSFSCDKTQLIAALILRAQHPQASGLPIRANGQVVGQTGPDGIGHVLLTGPKHQTIRIELDTNSLPKLLPKNPVRTFQLTDDGGIWLFDQTFSNAKKAPRKRGRRIKKKHVPRPTRIR